jgi:peptidoglycan hydrolase-like protein with peptidoglycan-binding domain
MKTAISGSGTVQFAAWLRRSETLIASGEGHRVSVRRLVVPVVGVMVGVALVAGCGSRASKQPPPSTSPSTTPPATTSTTKSTSAAHAGASTGSARQRPLGLIRRLQRDLKKLHLYAGPVTGVETAATKQAVLRFQRTAHLKPDGLWGPKSQAALDKMLGRKPSKPPPALGWIRNLQRDLSRLHFYSGPISGVETTATKIAVIRFQRAAHLKPDGLWGPKSQAALDKMLHRHP